MSENFLKYETSPYLLQHKDNDVHWMAWGEDAFKEAKRRDVPILLSIGYAACHWCHVMAHESFENTQIAQIMNEGFINIKVDREERPDVDDIYMSALHMMGEQGGWPLTMFLTPEQVPFYGGTYYPPESRWGRMGFPDLLQRINHAWNNHRDELLDYSAKLLVGLKQGSSLSLGQVTEQEDDPEYSFDAIQSLVSIMDYHNGGTQGAPKFPQPPIFLALWSYGLHQPHENHVTQEKLNALKGQARSIVILTWQKLCQGGIYDHLAGGFARYSVDARWLTPHFEKMLYDNGLILELLTLIYDYTQDDFYLRRIEETIHWVEQEMAVKGGGFASSLDADSEGEEGRFYVWSLQEITKILGDDADFFNQIYDVSAKGNWEEKNILNRLHHLPIQSSASMTAKKLEDQLLPLKHKLLDAREQRIRPACDDKILTDWNGYWVDSLAKAGRSLSHSSSHSDGWIDQACSAFDFVVHSGAKAMIGLTGTSNSQSLIHTQRNGQMGKEVFLDDYAAMCHAGLTLYEITHDMKYLDQIQKWIDELDQHFKSEASSGASYYMTPEKSNLLVRPQKAQDGPTPSGNGLMARVFARLWLLTGKSEYRLRGEAILTAFLPKKSHSAGMSPSLITAKLSMEHGASFVLMIGEGAKESEQQKWYRQIALYRLPDSPLLIFNDGNKLPDDHPAHGKKARSGSYQLYVCKGMICHPPIDQPDQIASIIRPNKFT